MYCGGSNHEVEHSSGFTALTLWSKFFSQARMTDFILFTVLGLCNEFSSSNLWPMVGGGNLMFAVLRFSYIRL